MSIGFFGKILRIDLSNEKIDTISPPIEIYRNYIGGYGLGCRLLYELMPPKIDPLSEASYLGFFPGLLTSTTAPFSGRYMVVGKSPLTETWGDSNAGGYFGPEIKRCGYDGILITGIAKRPVYVLIKNDDVEIHDASKIWGCDIIKSEKMLKEQHGNNVKVAGIGKAGENLVKFAGIANDKGRIAGRSGLGAIMGSKKLKMLVLKGSKKLQYYDRELFLKLVKEYHRNTQMTEMKEISKTMMGKFMAMAKLIRRMKIKMKSSPKMARKVYHSFGTIAGNTVSAEIGDSPVKNWKGVGMYDFPIEKSKKLSALNIIKYKIREYGCFSCPVQCGGILRIPELNIEETHQPEYETCCSFGTLLLNDDLMSIFRINDTCNREAIDTISTGSVIAFAIECYENKILSLKDLDGLELTWGNSEAIEKMVKKIINRDGFGNILAEGVKKASEKIGKGSNQFAMASLGSELPMHDPKFFHSLAFTYAYDPTPGRHTAASIDFTEVIPFDKFETSLKMPKNWQKDVNKKVEAQVTCTAFHQVLCSSGLCYFAPLFGEYPFLKLINALTGWDISIEECIKTGLRIQTLRQAFTLREGVNIAQNKLPGRVVGVPPLEKGPLKGVTVEYEEFYKNFCKAIGWNPDDGIPLEKTLKDLSLNFIIKDFY